MPSAPDVLRSDSESSARWLTRWPTQLDLAPWDIAAGALLVQLAGGTVTDSHGNPYSLRVRNVVAANSKISNDFLDTIGIANARDVES